MPIFPIPGEFGTEDDYQSKYTGKALLVEFGEDAYNRLGGFENVVRVKLEVAYLKHLTLIGAKERYGDPIPEDVMSRLEFELETIEKMGYPGYFLITQDFINKAREMGVIVGPGADLLPGRRLLIAQVLQTSTPLNMICCSSGF
ncbi:hypothetical protein MASR2M47_07640 [Draconibacterium sp.]